VGGVVVEARTVSRVAALPTWLLLAGVMAVAFVVRLVYALKDPAPWIFHDELAYSELAKSFAATGHFAIRDVPGTGGFGVLYPILISPAFALFDAVSSAYDGLKVINCLLVSLTAIPVYLIGKRIAGRWLSIAAAALSLAIPTLMYTSTVMTENAFYPLTAFFSLATIRALERPTVARQLVVFVLIGIAFLTRVQAIVFIPVLATALAVVVLLDVLGASGSLVARLWRAVAPYWPTLAVFALGAVAIPLRQFASGEPLTDVLGAYGGVTKLGYDWSVVAKYVMYHLADLDILVGVFPLAAFICFAIWSLRPSQPRSLRVFAGFGASLVVWFVIVAAAYGSTPVATRIVERNMFHVAPFLFLGLAAWIAHGSPRPWWAAAPAVVLAGGVTLTLPINSFLNAVVVHSTPALMPIWRWRDRLFSPGSIDEVVFIAAVLGALTFLLLPRRLAPILLLVLMVYFAAASRPVEGLTHGASKSSYDFGVGKVAPDWIDSKVGGQVASFWWGGTTAVPYWESEFFNRSVKRTYTLTGAYDGLVHTFIQLRLLPSGLFVDGKGKPVRQRYVLTDSGSRLRGRIIARDDIPGLVVYELAGPMTAAERVDGLFPDGWSGSSFGYRRFHCRPGALRLVLTNSAPIHPRPLKVTVLVNGSPGQPLSVSPKTMHREVLIPIAPENGECNVQLQMNAASATAIGTNDQRLLGLRFESVGYLPRR
jgi:hypothetical protein